MTPTSPSSPTSGPELRPSSAERVPYEESLVRALAEGRLGQQLFEDRLEAVAAAVNRRDLDVTVADIPFAGAVGEDRSERRTSRRGIVIGLLTLGVAGGASYWATRSWNNPTTTPATEETTHSGAASGEPDTPRSGSVATSLVSLPMRTKEMFPVMAAHLLSVKIDRLHQVYVHGEFVSVQGLVGDRSTEVTYRVDEEPKVRRGSATKKPTIPTSKIAALDAADLVRRSAERIAVGDSPAIRIDRVGETWAITLSGPGSDRLVWDITGTKILES